MSQSIDLTFEINLLHEFRACHGLFQTQSFSHTPHYVDEIHAFGQKLFVEANSNLIRIEAFLEYSSSVLAR
jgi:hypothetical protein